MPGVLFLDVISQEVSIFYIKAIVINVKYILYRMKLRRWATRMQNLDVSFLSQLELHRIKITEVAFHG